MKDVFAGIEPAVYQSGIKVPYSWWAGETASRFFTTIRDAMKITGTKCPQCGKVYVPPRKTCPVCFVANDQWVDVGPAGELVSFTVARRRQAALPREAPVIFGLIKLDGADTALLHHLDEIDPADLKIGMRVAARFADERTGTIMDIACFRPVR